MQRETAVKNWVSSVLKTATDDRRHETNGKQGIKKQENDNKTDGGSGSKEAKNGLTYNFDDESNETWYEGNIGGNRVRVLQEKVGDDSWWNVEVNGKLLKTDNGKAMSFKSAQEAADEAKEQINGAIKQQGQSKKKTAKVEFSYANKDDIMKEVNASKDAIKKYLGYPDAEITGIQLRSVISDKDKDGKNFKGIRITVSYNATDMYGNKGRKQPIDIVIDSNGYIRNHSSYYPSLRSAVKIEYGAPGRHLVPSFKDKFKVK